MLRLTRSGKIFVVVIVAMHFASITSQSGLLIWLVGLIVACLVVNAFAAMRAVRDVKVKPPARILIEEHTVPREKWQLVNHGKKVARLVTVESGPRVWLGVAEIAGGQTVEVAPRDVFTKRGVYPLADAWLVSLFPFGLIKAMRAIDSEAEVLVYPKLTTVAAPQVRGLDPMIGGKHTGPGRIASGEIFAGVRGAQPGDSFKQIHWKSSAKGVGLMVKTFEEELAGRAALLVYCDAPGPAAEACLRCAGGLAVAGLEAGHQIEFVNLNEARRVRTPPFGETTRLLSELARFDPAAKQFSAPSLDAALGVIPNRSSIHVIATMLTPLLRERIETLRADGKLVSVHLPEKAPSPDGLEAARFPVPAA